MSPSQIIFIAETSHGDLSYPSLAENLIKDCESRNLKIGLYTEFGNRERRLGSEDEKSLVDYFGKKEINQFVNERSTPIGNVFDRFNKLIPQFLSEVEKGDEKTPLQIFNKYKDQIDNPETLKILETEAKLMEQSGNLNGLEFAERNRNAFVQKMTHQQMARDLIAQYHNEDIIVVMAGSPHIFGIAEKLKKINPQFSDQKILIIGNIDKPIEDLSSLELIERAKEKCGKDSCERVGQVLEFKVINKQSQIPREVLEKLSEIEVQKNRLAPLDLAAPPSKKPASIVVPSQASKMSGLSKVGAKEV